MLAIEVLITMVAKMKEQFRPHITTSVCVCVCVCEACSLQDLVCVCVCVYIKCLGPGVFI